MARSSRNRELRNRQSSLFVILAQFVQDALTDLGDLVKKADAVWQSADRETRELIRSSGMNESVEKRDLLDSEADSKVSRLRAERNELATVRRNRVDTILRKTNGPTSDLESVVAISAVRIAYFAIQHIDNVHYESERVWNDPSDPSDQNATRHITSNFRRLIPQPRIDEAYNEACRAYNALRHADAERKRLTHPSAGIQRSRVRRDPLLDARNKWIYLECCKGIAHAKIKANLKRKCQLQPERKKWAMIESVQGIRQAAIAYASTHILEMPPSRHDK